MTNHGFFLGKVFGIPIRADMSVFILVAWILLKFIGELGLGMIYVLGLLFSILWHELAHSLTGMAFGCKVRVIVLQLMGGCAWFEQMPRKAWQEWLVSAAGPLSSFLLAGIFYIAALFTPVPLLMNALFLLAFINVLLGFFNLLPAFPLDGGRILRATLQSTMSRVRATWIASRLGRAIAVVFIVTGVLNFLNIKIPMVESQSLVLYYLQIFLFEGSVFKILIGFFIFQSAGAEYRMVLAQEAQERQSRGFGGNPFDFIPRAPRTDWTKPPDDDSGFVSPPPYRKDKPDRVDIKRGE